jgi:Chaperonin 10 Kd subunit
VGPGDRDKNGNVVPVSFKEGDEVLLPEYGGTEVKLGDKVYAPPPPHFFSFFFLERVIGFQL